MLASLVKYTLVVIVLLLNNLKAAEIKILNELNYPPFSAQQDGLSVEIVKAAYAAQQIESQFEAIPFARLVKMVTQGQALAGLNIIKEDYAQEQFIFPKSPIYSVTTQYFYHIDKPVDFNDPQKLNSKNTLVGDVIGFMYSPEHMARAFSRFQSNTEQQLLDMLLIKRLDAAYITKEVVCNLAIEQPKYLKQLKAEENIGSHLVDLYLAFSKQHPNAQKYADLFDQGLAKIKINGVYQQIVTKYLGKHCFN